MTDLHCRNLAICSYVVNTTTTVAFDFDFIGRFGRRYSMFCQEVSVGISLKEIAGADVYILISIYVEDVYEALLGKTA